MTTAAAITTIPDFLRGTSKKEKLSWILSLVLSVAYFGVFVTEAILSTTTNPHNDDKTMGLLLGFCVWGRPLQPDQTGGCHGSPENSHVLAFGVDLIYAGVVWYLDSYQRTTTGLQEPQQEAPPNKKLPTRKFVVVGAILLGHGVLHGVLYVWMDCHVATTPENLPWFVTLIGYSLYATFTFGLCFFILAMGFLLQATATTTGEDDEKNPPKGFPFDLTLEWTPSRTTTAMRIVCTSLVVTALVVILSLVTGSQWVLPSLFAVSHPLSSITGIWSPSPIFSSRMGWFFLVATVVGILELSTCQVFFRKVGGHVWYDIALHAAVLMGLPPFAPSTTGT